MISKKIIYGLLVSISFFSCNKKSSDKPTLPSGDFKANLITINDISTVTVGNYYHNTTPFIKFFFSAPIDKASTSGKLSLVAASGTAVPINISYESNDSIIVIKPVMPLNFLSRYIANVSHGLRSISGEESRNTYAVSFITAFDSTYKFPRLTDSALLELIQKQTFKYFYDFAHPVSGMARERNTSGDIVTTGGTGFGIMCLIVGAERNFISRNNALTQLQNIVSFLKNKCIAYHGVYAHWINGSTGETVPFSEDDNGADLVETSYLLQGLLCARQYFNNSMPAETNLRNDINAIWDAVDWNWFRQNNQDVLYWHWSPDKGFKINLAIKGWNEALIVYVLAASSNTNAINKNVYTHGWANNGGMINGNIYYDLQLPLGPPLGGPLFFAQYSFLGINPNGLSDIYSNYFTQNTNHSKINYEYCAENHIGFYGYSDSCWGLTASDDPSGYMAHSPTNDNGTISPTAAISSLPYTPAESMKAIRFFYYTLGDKLWKEYGFIDAFNLGKFWFADSFLAIDQGPQIVMIENYRSKLLWNLFMSCPEVKRGLKNLQFSGPGL